MQHAKKYKRQYQSNASNSFFSENVITVTMKFTWMIHKSFAIMRLFFHKVAIFNTLLPTLSTKLYTNVVEFPALTSEHIISSTRKLYTNCDNTYTEFVLTKT
jgi:hypothetical protein